MKKISLLVVAFAVVVLGLSSCQDNLVQPDNSVEGTYVGTLSFETGLKSVTTFADGDHDGTAEITDLGDGQLEVHCFGGELDTTFMLNYFNHDDSIMVCLEGEAFEEMYGHMMGDSTFTGNMMGNGNGNGGGMMGGSNGGMMGNNSSDNTDWMNHMNGNHAEGDEHFGGFDMDNQSFDYTMPTSTGEYHFQGTKRN